MDPGGGRSWKTKLREAATNHPLVLLAAVAGLAARLVYWQVTDRRFEDGLITITHAQSVIEGIGLTHHPGEPVTQGFRSAISVLVPLVGELIGEVLPFVDGVVDGFLAIRVLSLVAFVLTVVLADRIARRLGVGTWPRAFVLLYLAFDYNQVMYGMGGMETQLAVCILLAALDALMRRATIATGVFCGLALLVRPDFALFVGPALLALFLWRRSAGLRAAGLSLLVVAPWLLFTSLYYGSPVPNTIRAKSLRYHVDYPATASPFRWIDFLGDRAAERVDHAWHLVTPFLNNGFVVDNPLHPFVSAMIATAMIVLMVSGAIACRRIPGWSAVLAFLGLYGLLFVLALPKEGYYEWYFPPLLAIGVLCAGVALTRLGALIPRTSRAAAIAFAGLFIWPFPYMVVLDREIQHDIEAHVRVPMAKWLHDHVPPGAIVTSESSGYIGYYGRVKLYDYPGLTSKQALDIMEALGWERNSLAYLIRAARPDFIVLRPDERTAVTDQFPATMADYKTVREFAIPLANAPLTFGGVAMVNIDRDFLVMRRTG